MSREVLVPLVLLVLLVLLLAKAVMEWDTVSGEPQNWQWRSNEHDDAEGFEDGEIAKMALQGKPINWDGEEPELVEGEPEYEITKQAAATITTKE